MTTLKRSIRKHRVDSTTKLRTCLGRNCTWLSLYTILMSNDGKSFSVHLWILTGDDNLPCLFSICSWCLSFLCLWFHSLQPVADGRSQRTLTLSGYVLPCGQSTLFSYSRFLITSYVYAGYAPNGRFLEYCVYKVCIQSFPICSCWLKNISAHLTSIMYFNLFCERSVYKTFIRTYRFVHVKRTQYVQYCIPMFSSQINKLIEYYQQLAQRERQERDRKKLARRRPLMPMSFSVHRTLLVQHSRRHMTRWFSDPHASVCSENSYLYWLNCIAYT